MGLSGLEPPTSRLSGGRSNRLSYKPISFLAERNIYYTKKLTSSSVFNENDKENVHDKKTMRACEAAKQSGGVFI